MQAALYEDLRAHSVCSLVQHLQRCAPRCQAVWMCWLSNAEIPFIARIMSSSFVLWMRQTLAQALSASSTPPVALHRCDDHLAPK